MKIKIFGVLAVLVLLTGCSAGTKFTRISGSDLHLKQDTIQTIRGKLGKPFAETTLIKYGKTIKVLSYSFATPSRSLSAPSPSRTQAFHFYDDVLVGYIYTSTQKNDQTKFDTSKVQDIKENVTKIDEVLSWLGTPSGEYVYPMVEKENQKAKVYFYFEMKPGFKTPKLYQQILTVAYDPNGTVTKVDFLEGGN